MGRPTPKMIMEAAVLTDANVSAELSLHTSPFSFGSTRQRTFKHSIFCITELITYFRCDSIGSYSSHIALCVSTFYDPD